MLIRYENGGQDRDLEFRLLDVPSGESRAKGH